MSVGLSSASSPPSGSSTSRATTSELEARRRANRSSTEAVAASGSSTSTAGISSVIGSSATSSSVAGSSSSPGSPASSTSSSSTSSSSTSSGGDGTDSRWRSTMAAGRSISPSTSTAVSGPPASAPRPGRSRESRPSSSMSSARLGLEAGEDGVQLEPGSAQRVHHLAVAGLEGLDLRLREVAAAGEVGEDPLPQLAGLGDHRPPFGLGRLDLGFSGRPAPPAGGGRPRPRRRRAHGRPRARHRGAGGRTLPRPWPGSAPTASWAVDSTRAASSPSLAATVASSMCSGAAARGLLPGVVEIPRQPVPLVLEPAHLLGDLAEEGADGGRIEPLAGGRERRTGDAAG